MPANTIQDIVSLTRDQIASITGDNHQRIKFLEAMKAQVLFLSATPTDPIGVPVSGSSTITLDSVDGQQTIRIAATNLVATVGGPFVITLTTGLGGSDLRIPIFPAGTTISSGDLLFDILIDEAGNIVSKAWSVRATRGNLACHLFHDGWNIERALLNNGAATQTWTFIYGFAALPNIAAPGMASAAARFATLNNIATTSVDTLGWTDAGVASTENRTSIAEGRWW